MATSPTARVFRTSKASKAAIFLEEESVSMIGDKSHFITCDRRGTTIRGAVSYVSDSADRRSSGLFVGLTDFMQMIPSTIITPLPHRLPFPPAFAIAGISKDLAFFMSLMV